MVKVILALLVGYTPTAFCQMNTKSLIERGVSLFDPGIAYNPGYALAKTMLAEGFKPASQEFRYTDHQSATDVVAQLAMDASGRPARVYYTPFNVWNPVWWVDVNSAGALVQVPTAASVPASAPSMSSTHYRCEKNGYYFKFYVQGPGKMEVKVKMDRYHKNAMVALGIDRYAQIWDFMTGKTGNDCDTSDAEFFCEYTFNHVPIPNAKGLPLTVHLLNDNVNYELNPSKAPEQAFCTLQTSSP